MEELELLKKFLEALERRDIKAIAACLHDDLKMINPASTMNREAYLDFKRSLFEAFPDFKYNPEIIGKEGDYYNVKIRMQGTHTGMLRLDFAGPKSIAPTGRKLDLPEQLMRYSFRDGRIFIIKPVDVRGGGIIGILRQAGAKLPPQFVIDIMIKAVSISRFVNKVFFGKLQ
jgi:predicted ester cyclase